VPRRALVPCGAVPTEGFWHSPTKAPKWSCPHREKQKHRHKKEEARVRLITYNKNPDNNARHVQGEVASCVCGEFIPKAAARIL
jgi:hypothetical protein